jgi:hypothetical protein
MATYYDSAIKRFALHWQDLYQQKMSRLKDRVTIDNFTGTSKRTPLVASEEFAARTRLQDSSPSEATVTFRTHTTSPFKLYKWYDKDDDEFLLGDMESPTSSLLRIISGGYNRLCDQTIYDACFANSAEGADGGTSTAYPAGQSIAVDYVYTGSAVNSGLTEAKLIEARSKFGENEVTDPDDPTPLVCICRQAQLDDLLRDPKVQSGDYNTVKALVTGQINTWMGIRFVRFSGVTVSTADVAACAVYHKDALKFNPGKREVYVDILPTKQHARQVGGYARLGGMREQDEGVVRIYCDQSP